MTQLILGLEGLTLSLNDRRRLSNKRTAGVILFSRNYQNNEQLRALTTDIRTLREDLLISVDHEGGRVQRFKKGFSELPPASCFLSLFRRDPEQALALASLTGQILATELLAHGVDLSYAPVLDLDYGVSAIIGNRSFGMLPFEVAKLAGAMMAGMLNAGMKAVGKHFPGHGGVEVDTHGAVAIDDRHYDYLAAADLAVFKALIDEGVSGIMPAHVIYPQIDSLPAGFSVIWLQKILRQEYRFKGAIISDDIDMLAAAAVGDLAARLDAAVAAGCDLILACNDFASMDFALAHLPIDENPLVKVRIDGLKPVKRLDHSALLEPDFLSMQQQLHAFTHSMSLYEPS